LRIIADPGVTQITCISRREVGVRSPKVSTILHDDFAIYGQPLFDRISDHSGCIWALGGTASDLGLPDVLARVTHTFTIALARAVAANAQGRFTFCYLSGMGADLSETAWFPWERLTRHLKGRTERDLSTIQQSCPNFSAHSYRPGGILPKSANPLLRAFFSPIVVDVGDLPEAMILGVIAPEMFRQSLTITNREIKRLARKRSHLRCHH
jgi:hypothetical protein